MGKKGREGRGREKGRDPAALISNLMALSERRGEKTKEKRKKGKGEIPCTPIELTLGSPPSSGQPPGRKGKGKKG